MGSSLSSLSPPSPAYVPDDVVSQILLRLPPHPSYLLRVSLVSKRFRRLVNDRAFLSSFRARHRGTPPLLGFFHNEDGLPYRFLPVEDGVCAAVVEPNVADWTVLDSRHGLVLLQSPDKLFFLVWDPMTRRRQEIPAPLDSDVDYVSSNATVVCTGGNGDHAADCPFEVIFVTIEEDEVSVTVSVYSSQDEDWSLAASGEVSSVIELQPSVLVGNVLYWTLLMDTILAFGLDTDNINEIAMPPEAHSACEGSLLVMEDGMLGLAAMKNCSLHLWAHLTDGGGAAQWVLRKVVELDKQLPLAPSLTAGYMRVRMLGQDEDAQVAFLQTEDGIFALRLQSMQCKKLIDNNMLENIYPYKRFFLQGKGGHIHRLNEQD